MEIIASRIRGLRENAKLSQNKLAKIFGLHQSSLFRYESNESAAPAEVLLQYADFFHVSMDYIYGRTDDPNGGNFICATQFTTEEANFDAFLEMCFDPRTEANKKLKAALKRLMREGNY